MAKKKAAAKSTKPAAIKSAGTGDDPGQTYIEGLEQPKVSELDDAIMSYEAAICERKRIREEVEDRARVLPFAHCSACAEKLREYAAARRARIKERKRAKEKEKRKRRRKKRKA